MHADGLFELDHGQGEVMLRGIASAVRDDGALSPTQRDLLDAIGTHVIGVDVAAAELEPITASDLADALPDASLRRGVVRAMTTLEIITQPVSPEVSARVDEYAKALHVDEGMLAVARDYSQGAMNAAIDDYLRNSYFVEYNALHANDGSLHRTVTAPGADAAVDAGLAAQWRALEGCPSGSLGRAVWDFYQYRGFSLPGTPGSVDALLAQHDWVHCLADYGTAATGEIEVFSFLAAAIPDAKGFSYLVVILGLFETGYFAQVPGVATANPGHLSRTGGPTRFADAIHRGIELHLDVMGGVDWFAYADDPIDDVRARLGVVPKAPDAIAAGSLSATDPDAVFGRSA